jgi:hypothetical protein
MDSVIAFSEVYVKQASIPCKRCNSKPNLDLEARNYDIPVSVILRCEVCKQIQSEEINPLEENPRLRAWHRCVRIWNDRNRMVLEWFTQRVIPSSADLQKWDSQNSLRP